MAQFSKSKAIGQSANVLTVMMINGSALAKGDSSNRNGEAGNIPSTTTANDNAVGMQVGWDVNTGTPLRKQPIIKIPLKDVIPAFSRILRATLFWRITAKGSWPSNVVDLGGNVTFYAIVRPGFDLSTCDYANYKTGGAWQEYGAKVGGDLGSDSLGLVQFTQSDYDLMAANANLELEKQVPLTTWIQYSADRNQDAFIMGLIAGNYTSGDHLFVMENPNDAGRAGKAHSYVLVEYVPPIVFHGSLSSSGRAIDLSRVLDADSFESIRHVYGGFIDQGETGDQFKYWIRNTRNERIARRIVLEATRSFASKPTANAANTGNAALRSVDCFDLTVNISNVITKLTPRGAWELRFTSATLYDVYFAADFATNPDGTYNYSVVVTGRSIASDETITVSSVDKIKIRAAKWSGTPVNSDKINFETVGDTTATTYLADSKDMMYLTPPTTVAGDTPDTAKRRSIKGRTQQTRVSSYVVVDGGLNRTVLCLGDANSGFTVGGKAVVFDGTNHEEVTIRQIYNTAAALPGSPPAGAGTGDAIMLEEETANTYAAGSWFTTGLYVNQLDKSDDTFVNTAGAAAGQANIPITPAVTWITNDSFYVVSLSTGQVQELVVQTNNGSTITAASNLNFALVAGDLVIKKNATNGASFFFQGQVPDGANLGDRLSILRAYEARQSLKNII